MKKKKIVLILAGCLLIAGVSFGATYSYMKASDEVVNNFEIGRNEIEVTEEYEPPEKLTPGVAFTKKPCVKNTGNIACWVRMRADFSDSEMEKFCNFTINKTVDSNGGSWTEKQPDGYYYYTQKLAPNATTSSLFAETEYTNSSGETGNMQIKETLAGGEKVDESKLVNFDILIYAESCGAKEGETYEKAWGLS